MMRKRVASNLGLAVLSAILLILAWPQSQLNFLLLVAFVPVLIVCFRQEKVRSAAGYFYLTMLLFIGESQSTVMAHGEYHGPLIAGVFIVPLFWILPMGLTIWVKRRAGLTKALLLFPFFYLSHEVLEYYWPFAVTWFQLGLGVSNNTFFHGVYPILGQEGTGLLIMCFNVALVFAYFHWKSDPAWKLLLPNAIILSIFLVTFLLASSAQNTKSVSVAVYQPGSASVDSLENNINGQIDALEAVIKNADLSKVDLLVCPESYFHDMKNRPLLVNEILQHPAIQRIQEISERENVAILSGAILVEFFRAKEPPTLSSKQRSKDVYFDIYNGSLFFTPKRPVTWRTKQTLVPFSENIPFFQVFNWLESKGVWPSRFEKAYGRVPFSGTYNYNGLRIAPGVCFESLFPHIMAGYNGRTANLQVILSTKWTDSEAVMQQHEDHMIVNVKSFGRPLLFASTDHSSTFHDQNGVNMLGENDLEIVEFSLFSDNTPYQFLAQKPWIWFFLTIFLYFVLPKSLKKA